MPEETEKEIELKELDKQGKPTGKKIKVKVKKAKGEKKAVITVGGKSMELTDLKKNKKPKQGDKDVPAKISGLYDAPDFYTNRDVTIIVDCDAKPPTVEIVITYATGDDKGKRDEDNCQKFEIDPAECPKLKAFIWQLEVPELLALGPDLPVDMKGDEWIASALGAMGEVLLQAGTALAESRPEWLMYADRVATFPTRLPGTSVLLSRHSDVLELVVSASKTSLISAAGTPRRSKEEKDTGR
jgi:hypothetical protein